LLIAKKASPDAKLEKHRILALGIFGLDLCPSTTGIISLEAANLFVECEKTKINPCPRFWLKPSYLLVIARKRVKVP